jgi:hypothetical protein
MASKAFVRQEIVKSESLDPEDLRCPRCNGNDVIIYGFERRPRVDSIVGGEVEASYVDGESSDFSVERLDCLPCSTTFLIVDQDKALKDMEVTHLREELRRCKGGLNYLGDEGTGS